MKLVLLFCLLALSIIGVHSKQAPRASNSACSIPSEYWKGLNWKGQIKKQCTKVGSGTSMEKCDKCFAAFVAAQSAEVIKYIDLMEAFKDPAGTLSSTISQCSPVVTKIMNSKLSKKDRKKVKNVKKCLQMNVLDMPLTQAAVDAQLPFPLG